MILFNQDAPPLALTQLASSLSRDEQQRMTAYYTPQLQARYLARRGVLRYLCAHLCNVHPTAIRFRYAPRGKPYLVKQPYQFNLSHSQHLALIGLSRVPIGLDIEALRASNDLAAITQTHFAPEEQSAWAALPQEQRVQGFYNAWTRKEAFIKMDGRGLGIPLSSFVVTLHPNVAPQIVRSDRVDASHWHLHHLLVPDGFAGALVVGTQVTDIALTSWQ